MDGRWTGCGRAGAAEIAWEEARDGECQDPVDRRWTGCGRAGAAEIAWEEGIEMEERDRMSGSGGRAADGRELQK